MAAVITHRAGDMEDYEPSKIPQLIAKLDGPLDEEHPDVSVSHESGWTIAGYGGGSVVWENVEDDVGSPRHMEGVSDCQLAKLMQLVADGQFDKIERLGWLPGYGS